MLWRVDAGGLRRATFFSVSCSHSAIRGQDLSDQQRLVLYEPGVWYLETDDVYRGILSNAVVGAAENLMMSWLWTPDPFFNTECIYRCARARGRESR